jgi:protein phosphatase
MRYSAASDPGRVRLHNEDALVADPDLGVWLVADGMGGHASGEVASALVVDTVITSIAGGGALQDAVLGAHSAIEDAAAASPERRGMGSTVVALSVHGDQAELIWVGDSRAYRWRAGSLCRLSRDHSLVEALLAEQRITPEQADDHPQRHVITQSLGLGDPEPSRLDVDLAAGDWILLCSDGLSDELRDGEIAEVLAANVRPRGAVAALIDEANSRGGHDNISVVIVEPVRVGWRWPAWAPIVLGSVAALVVAMFFWLVRGG